MAPIDSFFAASIKAQVLTTSTWASAGSSVISKPARINAPSINSLSARFLGHPSVRRWTFSMSGTTEY